MEMSYLEHLEELRWRIIKSLAAFVVAALGVFYFQQPILTELKKPISTRHAELVFTSIPEYFMAVIKVSLLGGLYLSLPVTLYQFLAFVSPGLTSKESKWAIPLTLASFILFTIGALFGYYLLLPTGLGFLIGFAPSSIKPMLSIEKYLGFSAGAVFATGISFLLPVFLLVASVIGLTTSYFLARYRRQAILVAFVLAAIITPSIDIFTQVILAVALYILFELGIILIRLTGK
jgi:sec-independent protein translocase protein TatC